MGEVYKARDTRLDLTVAIKALPERIANREDLHARFEREARASLNHPNICSLFDIGAGYMVMELIEGETLAARIEKGPLPIDQALKIATQRLPLAWEGSQPSVYCGFRNRMKNALCFCPIRSLLTTWNPAFSANAR